MTALKTMPGKREKYRITLTDLQHDLETARELYRQAEYVKSFDLYEQMVEAYPEHSIPLLADLYDHYQALRQRDRYSLYQSRYFNFDIKPGDKVLDVGSGHIPFPLATHLSDITLTDHGYGRAGVPFKYVDGKPVFECSVEAMPFGDKEFDFVYCSHVLEHAKHPGKACGELMRIARRGYIETPTRGKDIFLNSAKVSGHTQYVEAINNCLVFTEYLPEEIEGLQCSILQDMHADPQTPREKAFSALIYLKADLINTMFLWEGTFDCQVIKKSAYPESFAALQVETTKPAPAITIETGRPFPEKRPTFLQIHNFYPAYIERLYQKLPGLDGLSFQEQINTLIADGFSGAHMFAPYMGELGYDSQLIIANSPYSQVKWLLENGQDLTDRNNWELEILKKQVDTIKPDILYLSHPTNYDSRFLRSLNHKPPLVLGWRASMIPEGTDWSEFDVMLSSLSALRGMALRIGAKAAEHFFPGYPTWINDKLTDIQQEYDVVFPGSWSTGLHAGRNQILQRVAVEAVDPIHGFSCGYYLSGEVDAVPPEVARFNLGERFGVDMHRALKSGKIVLDARGVLFMRDAATGTTIDLAGKETGNMRLFEATGAGVFLLAEHYDNLCEYFEPGEEIETYRSQQELIDKIRYYLAHPEEREKIALRGQQRCLEQYSMGMRAKEMDRIIAKYLVRKHKNLFSHSETVISLKNQAVEFMKENKVQDAFNTLIKAKACKEPLENLDLMRAHCFLIMNLPDAAIQALLEELRFFPNNQQACQLLVTLQSEKEHHRVGLLDDSEFQAILTKIRPYTMLGEARLYNIYRLARYVCENNIPGNFVECGVAAGGTSALLAYIINKYSKTQRQLFAFDSFEGMPEPTENDSVRGIEAEATGWGTGTCAAPETSLRAVAEKLGVEHIIKPVKGYFDITLPFMRDAIGQIAFMHMDADWYESIKTILENFYDLLADHALVQLDDYGYWVGCAKALHEFEMKRDLAFKLEPIEGSAVWFQKPVSPEIMRPVAVLEKLKAMEKTSRNPTKSSIKIIQLCTFASGGAGKAAYRLHHGLCEAGLDSTFLCLSKGGADPTVKVIHGVVTSMEAGYAEIIGTIYSRWDKILLDHPLRPSGLEMFSDADSPVQLASLEEIGSADVIHLHWIAGLVDYGKLGIALHGKKVVWTLHDMNPFTGGCHYAGKCQRYQTGCGACPQLGSTDSNDLSRKIWEKKRAGLSGLDIVVVAPSRWLATCAAQSAIFRDCRIVCIPNGVPTDVFHPTNREEVRKTLNIPLDARIILFGADNLSNQRKGFGYLLEALRSYRANAEIILATFGVLDPSVTINSPYRVISLGAIHDEWRLACVYGMADLLVIPSLEDNLPNTVLEAMACGTPVVGFAIGGIPDMIDHKKTGYLAAAADVSDLMAGIDWVLLNPDKVLFHENCRQKINAIYTIPNQVARFEILYSLTSDLHRMYQ